MQSKIGCPAQCSSVCLSFLIIIIDRHFLQPQPAFLSTSIGVQLDTVAVPGGQQQQAGVLAGRDRGDDQLDGVGCVMQWNSASSCSNWRPIKSSISSFKEKSSTRGTYNNKRENNICHDERFLFLFERFSIYISYVQVPVELTYLQLTFLDLAANRLSSLPVELR